MWQQWPFISAAGHCPELDAMMWTLPRLTGHSYILITCSAAPITITHIIYNLGPQNVSTKQWTKSPSAPESFHNNSTRWWLSHHKWLHKWHTDKYSFSQGNGFIGTFYRLHMIHFFLVSAVKKSHQTMISCLFILQCILAFCSTFSYLSSLCTKSQKFDNFYLITKNK